MAKPRGSEPRAGVDRRPAHAGSDGDACSGSHAFAAAVELDADRTTLRAAASFATYVQCRTPRALTHAVVRFVAQGGHHPAPGRWAYDGATHSSRWSKRPSPCTSCVPRSRLEPSPTRTSRQFPREVR